MVCEALWLGYWGNSSLSPQVASVWQERKELLFWRCFILYRSHLKNVSSAVPGVSVRIFQLAFQSPLNWALPYVFSAHNLLYYREDILTPALFTICHFLCPRQLKTFSIYFIFKYSIYLFYRERNKQVEQQRKKEKQASRQAGSLTQGSIPRLLGHDLSRKHS